MTISSLNNDLEQHFRQNDELQQLLFQKREDLVFLSQEKAEHQIELQQLRRELDLKDQLLNKEKAEHQGLSIKVN